MQHDKNYFAWIETHAKDNPSALRLKYAGKNDAIDYQSAIIQIECRRKFASKFSRTLAAFPDFYFPSLLAGEQATGDIAAEWHASLVPEDMDAVDFTAGLGNDSLHFAARASSVISVERNPDLVEALVYNAAGLRVDNLTAISADCRDYLSQLVEQGSHFGFAFIDPARRAADGGRVFALADCEPDVVAMIPDFARVTDLLLVKASPMLDISHTISSLPRKPWAVVALGTPTECKELLILVDFRLEPEETMIEAVTLRPDDVSTFSFTQSRENALPLPRGTMPSAGEYIFEPWPAVMKTGAFRTIADAFGLRTINPNTRLFHAEAPVTAFPGNTYEILKVLPYASGVIKRFRKEYPAVNVAVRNFGITADALRAKLGVADAGPLRLYGITGPDSGRYLVLTKPFER